MGLGGKGHARAMPKETIKGTATGTKRAIQMGARKAGFEEGEEKKIP